MMNKMKKGLIVLSILIVSTTAGLAQLAVDKPADIILKDALTKAKKEDKNVFLLFHASWCGWCHLLDSVMNDPACKKLFDDNYVIEHVTIMQLNRAKTPGGMQLYVKYGGLSGSPLRPDSSKSAVDLERLAKKYELPVEMVTGAPIGIPYYVIIGADGELLAAGKLSNSNTVGYPGLPERWSIFENMLQKTSRLNAQQIAIINNVVKQKKDKAMSKATK